MGFGDLRDAARMRDLMERIAAAVVDKKRPEVRIGRVYKVDSGNQVAWVLYPGETEDNLVKVRAAANMIPAKSYDKYADQCDIVRVAGRPGNYYIIDFIRGTPVPPAMAYVIPGAIFMWPGDSAPAGYLLLDGTVYNTVDYPNLAPLCGSKFGGNGTSTFAVPDMRGRFPWGAIPGTIAGAGIKGLVGDFETNYQGASPGAAADVGRLDHQHYHTLGSLATNTTGSGHTHDLSIGTADLNVSTASNTTTGGSASRVTSLSGTTVNGHNHTGSTALTTGGVGHTHGVQGQLDTAGVGPNLTSSFSYHGFMTLNFIVKT